MMRKAILAALVFMIAGVAGTAARADEKKGLYIGAAAGYGSQEFDISTESFQDNTTSWKGIIGYRFMRFLGFEAAYVDFGTASDDLNFGGGSQSVDVKTHGEIAEITGTLPLGSFFELYGKAGYLWWNTDVNGQTSTSDSGDDPVYGAGARIIIGKRFGIRLEYEKFDIKDTKSVYLTTAGIEWRF
jgi:opacity protein-like surface antigen